MAHGPASQPASLSREHGTLVFSELNPIFNRKFGFACTSNRRSSTSAATWLE